MAGITLTALAQRVHYSKGQLSKVERGLKAPSRELARLCDATLDAGGELASLVHEAPSRSDVTAHFDGDQEVWLMQFPTDGNGWFQPMSRRQAMAAGGASVAGLTISLPAISANAEDTTLVGTFRSLFDHYRKLGQAAGPGLLLPALIAQTHALQELSRSAGPHTRQELLRLGSRYGEYIGWLVQETGDEQGALWWTRRAVALAGEGGDPHLAAYGLVRRALVALYRADAEQTIELARRAQSGRLPSRIRGLAAQREAQGHALAGDHDTCMRRLDQARALLAHHTDSDAPVIGTTNLTDPAEMVRGWCLYDLGRPRHAAEVIETQLTRVPQEAVRTRVRFGVRCALAYAAAGEIDHACTLTRELLQGVITVGSATVATDLRALSRHPKNALVRELAPELSSAMRTFTP
jgi:hypothetical protein